MQSESQSYSNREAQMRKVKKSQTHTGSGYGGPTVEDWDGGLTYKTLYKLHQL